MEDVAKVRKWDAAIAKYAGPSEYLRPGHGDVAPLLIREN